MKCFLKFCKVILVYFLLSMNAFALSFSEPKVTSYLNEPLKINIQVQGEEQPSVQLAAPVEYLRMGYSQPQQELFVIQDPNDASLLTLASKTPIREPAFVVLLEVNLSDRRSIVEVQVLLDPKPSEVVETSDDAEVNSSNDNNTEVAQGDQQDSENRETIEETEEKAKEESTAVASETDKKEVRYKTVVQESVIYSPTSKKYGPVAQAETLWSIANKTRPEGVSANEMITAIKALNPNAFSRGVLVAGVVLDIPDPRNKKVVKKEVLVQDETDSTAETNVSSSEAIKTDAPTAQQQTLTESEDSSNDSKVAAKEVSTEESPINSQTQESVKEMANNPSTTNSTAQDSPAAAGTAFLRELPPIPDDFELPDAKKDGAPVESKDTKTEQDQTVSGQTPNDQAVKEEGAVVQEKAPPPAPPVKKPFTPAPAPVVQQTSYLDMVLGNLPIVGGGFAVLLLLVVLLVSKKRKKDQELNQAMQELNASSSEESTFSEGFAPAPASNLNEHSSKELELPSLNEVSSIGDLELPNLDEVSSGGGLELPSLNEAVAGSSLELPNLNEISTGGDLELPNLNEIASESSLELPDLNSIAHANTDAVVPEVSDEASLTFSQVEPSPVAEVADLTEEMGSGLEFSETLSEMTAAAPKQDVADMVEDSSGALAFESMNLDLSSISSANPIQVEDQISSEALELNINSTDLSVDAVAEELPNYEPVEVEELPNLETDVAEETIDDLPNIQEVDELDLTNLDLTAGFDAVPEEEATTQSGVAFDDATFFSAEDAEQFVYTPDRVEAVTEVEPIEMDEEFDFTNLTSATDATEDLSSVSDVMEETAAPITDEAALDDGDKVKLELAEAYMEFDPNLAKSLLKELIEEGNPEALKRASELLKKIG